ncbi:MAG: hypothetical protein ACFE85_12810 [Candidatus Hodarchaeota archaeon]
MSEEEIGEFWKVLLKKHWLKLIPFALVIIAAFISGIYVFLWHNEIGVGFGSYWSLTFNDWSFGIVFVYLLMLLLREFLLVGLPTLAVLGMIFGITWAALSPETREELKAMNKREDEEKKKRRKSGEGAGGFTAIVTIAFLIIMAINGKWNTPFGNMDFQYFVITYLQAMFWVAIFVGIPVLIGGIFYLRHKLK